MRVEEFGFVFFSLGVLMSGIGHLALAGVLVSRLFCEWFIWPRLFFSEDSTWDEIKVLLILCSWDIYCDCD